MAHVIPDARIMCLDLPRIPHLVIRIPCNASHRQNGHQHRRWLDPFDGIGNADGQWHTMSPTRSNRPKLTYQPKHISDLNMHSVSDGIHMPSSLGWTCHESINNDIGPLVKDAIGIADNMPSSSPRRRSSYRRPRRWAPPHILP